MTARGISESVPNDGLIRYYSFLSQERLLLTAPKAFAQMLVHDSYNYQRMPQIKFALSLITGHGVGYAEGQDHKASFFCDVLFRKVNFGLTSHASTYLVSTQASRTRFSISTPQKSLPRFLEEGD